MSPRVVAARGRVTRDRCAPKDQSRLGTSLSAANRYQGRVRCERRSANASVTSVESALSAQRKRSGRNLALRHKSGCEARIVVNWTGPFGVQEDSQRNRAQGI